MKEARLARKRLRTELFEPQTQRRPVRGVRQEFEQFTLRIGPLWQGGKNMRGGGMDRRKLPRHSVNARFGVGRGNGCGSFSVFAQHSRARAGSIARAIG